MSPGHDAARLASAFGLLQGGRAAEALAIVREVATRTTSSPDALHLQALCHKALGEYDAAGTAFEAALALAPSNPDLLGNYANFLTRAGHAPDAIGLYRRQLALAPGHGDGWMNLGLALLSAGRPTDACDALERVSRLRPGHAATHQALGSARRAAGDLLGAREALLDAVRLAPGNGAAWVNLGVVHRLLGDPEAALECCEKARLAGFTGPELADIEASAHLDSGETRRALTLATALVETSPGYAPGHALLANILWEHGKNLRPGAEPRASFRAALHADPANSALRREFVRFLDAAGDYEEALREIRLLRSAADSPELAGMEASMLDSAGEQAAAASLFTSLLPALGQEPGFLNRYLSHLFRAGDAEQAAAVAEAALAAEPGNQLTLAFLGLAWRLTGDPREHWLCGYDRFVAEIEIAPPPGFGDEAAFLKALACALLPLHRADREPVNQSLRGGSQTAGVLFSRPEPAIAGLRDVLADAVACYAAALPDEPGHPFLGRKSRDTRFAGSWSVRLRAAGRHVAHIHQEGWISSAFYVALPPSVAAAAEENTAGCLQFGVPPAPLGFDIPARRIVRPRPGRLVLFPSYLWHGTLPFEDDAPRLSVAFDVVPAGS